MATRENLRRIALALPDTTADETDSSYSVAGKAIAWTWRERVDPKKARVPNGGVIAVRVAHESEKELLIDMDSSVDAALAQKGGRSPLPAWWKIV